MVDFRFSYVDIMVRSARRLDGTGRTGYIYNWKMDIYRCETMQRLAL